MSEKTEQARVFKFGRSHLFLGGERELVLITSLLCLILIVVLQNLLAATVGLLLWTGLLPVYRLMARADPRMTQVYRAYSRHQSFYAAHGMKHHGKQK